MLSLLVVHRVFSLLRGLWPHEEEGLAVHRPGRLVWVQQTGDWASFFRVRLVLEHSSFIQLPLC